MPRNQPVNYESLKYLKSIIHPQIEILQAYVHNKYLVAVLSSGITFRIKNNIS